MRCTRNNRTNATWEANRQEIINDSIAYGILMTLTAIMQLVTGIFSVDLFNHAALKQITRIRVKYFQSLMRQDIGWYDTSTGNNFAVRITEYVCAELVLWFTILLCHHLALFFPVYVFHNIDARTETSIKYVRALRKK